LHHAKDAKGAKDELDKMCPPAKKLLTFNFVFMFCFFILRADPMTEQALIVGGSGSVTI